MWFFKTWLMVTGCSSSEASGGGKPTVAVSASDLAIEARAGGHFRLVNRSAHTLDVLPPLDGSLHKRHPRVDVAFRDADGHPVPFDTAGCGLVNPLTEADFVTVKPGEGIDLLPSPWLRITAPLGATEIRVSYVTEGFPESELTAFSKKRLPLGTWTSDWVDLRSCDPMPKDGQACIATALCAESPHSYLECSDGTWTRITELYGEP